MAIGTAALAIALPFAGAALAQGPAATSLLGVWRNPKNTVHVQIRSCGVGICGDVVWASPKAQDDARKGSGRPLIGMQLFRDLRPTSAGVWKGKVYVPDVNGTFGGSAEPVNASTLRATGCLFAGLLCKSQTWTRIEGGAV